MIGHITFDVAGNPEMPTLILMTKGQKNIGEITNFTAFHFSPHMNSIDEISFVLYITFPFFISFIIESSFIVTFPPSIFSS